MRRIRTVLIGLGSVNIGLLKIWHEKTSEIATRYDLTLRIVAVADSSGIAVKDLGYTFEELIELKEEGKHTTDLEGYLPGETTMSITDRVAADLLVEGAPANLTTGNPGLHVMRCALKKGWVVVSANKAPLVLAFDEFNELAGSRSKKLSYSAAVCGGLPVINILRRDLIATRLFGLKGIFNATCNFILQELENGGGFDEAVKEAQRVGAAEADPSLDIDGYDTANKLYIIMKSFTDFSGELSDIAITGIRNISKASLKHAADQRKKIKLLAIAERRNQQWHLEVKPTEVPCDSFLGRCDGWEMGIRLQTDFYEDIALKIREESPVATSAAVLRDIVNAFVED